MVSTCKCVRIVTTFTNKYNLNVIMNEALRLLDIYGYILRITDINGHVSDLEVLAPITILAD